MYSALKRCYRGARFTPGALLSFMRRVRASVQTSLCAGVVQGTDRDQERLTLDCSEAQRSLERANR